MLFELTLTRIFSIILWYDYAFMAISVAFFGLGIGSLLVHILKNKIMRIGRSVEEVRGKGEDKKLLLPSNILQSTLAFAASMPIFLFVVGHIIPPNTSFIYIFYLASSIPFFFAGMSMALIYLAMPREISKLYFVDLIGAAAATLVLDSLLQTLGAESILLFIAILVTGSSLISASVLFIRVNKRNNVSAQLSPSSNNVVIPVIIDYKTRLYGAIVMIASTVLLIVTITTAGYNNNSNILAIQPGESKGLHYQLSNTSTYEHLLTRWNSFSRIDITKQIHSSSSDRVLASIIIDADAVTPVLRWNGSLADSQWILEHMDYIPYEISKGKVNNTLVIGGGGGEDILVALTGGSKEVTVVELNPLIVAAAKQFGNLTGNLYNNRNDVQLHIDDGRRFISSTNAKYDIIVLKLVDSWAAQLAGGYALSENYLYTVEAFRQYLHHLNENNGMLVMVRWNFELPRLIPLVAESLRQEKYLEALAGEKESIQQDYNITQQILVVEDRPGLYFGSNDQRTIYPVLLIIKNSPFAKSEINLVKERIAKNDAKIIAIPGEYIQSPYDRVLLSSKNYHSMNSQQLSESNIDNHKGTTLSLGNLKPPTDDSPFYFAKEQIPQQLIILLETVLGVSAVLTLLLIYYSRMNKIRLTAVKSWSSHFHIIFVVFIGFGFIFLEITFIQKFLLLLGTPIMALTVILFSILLSGGIGAYLSGRLFNKNPYKAVIVSIPLLVGIVLAYYVFLQEIIDLNIILLLPQRIALTFALLSPAGLLMGFQFPSITRMTYIQYSIKGHSRSSRSSGEATSDIEGNNITLLWGVNVIASVIGTVLTAISSMVIGFSGNLLIGIGLYIGALVSAIAAAKLIRK